MEEVTRMRMGCDLIDLLVGGAKGVYGLPYGSILQIIGDRSAGKSFLKNEIIASNHHLYGDLFKWFSDDTETGDTFDTQNLYGVSIRERDESGKLILGTEPVEDSETVEDMDAHVSKFLKYLNGLSKDTVGLYAIDSLDGLSDAEKEAREAERLEQFEDGKDVQNSGTFDSHLQKFLSQEFFKTKHKKLEDMKCSLIFVSQIRDKINSFGYGPKWTVAGGKAIEFYAHTRVFLKTIRKIEREGRVVGAYISATTLKSKTPRPFREVRYTTYFDYGIDNIGSNLDFLFDLRDETGKLKGDNITWSSSSDGETHILNKDTVKEWLQENGYLAECRKARKEEEKNNNLTLDYAKKWVMRDEERAAQFKDYFGETYTRDELIQMCDEDPEMAEELTRRVREKWESIEDAASTKRKKKYA